MLFFRRGLYQSFYFSTQALGVQSVPGHKPPVLNDTPIGRYAGSLFSAASKKQALQQVLEDIGHLREVIQKQPAIREFLKNSAIKKTQQHQVFNSFTKTNYHQITIKFIDSVIDGGRLSDLQNIINKYISYCKILNKQQDITIISAKQLNDEQKKQVQDALLKKKPDTKFKITYHIDANILGGLQLYIGSEFLDCSLRSRIIKLKNQISKI